MVKIRNILQELAIETDSSTLLPVRANPSDTANLLAKAEIENTLMKTAIFTNPMSRALVMELMYFDFLTRHSHSPI